MYSLQKSNFRNKRTSSEIGTMRPKEKENQTPRSLPRYLCVCAERNRDDFHKRVRTKGKDIFDMSLIAFRHLCICVSALLIHTFEELNILIHLGTFSVVYILVGCTVLNRFS